MVLPVPLGSLEVHFTSGVLSAGTWMDSPNSCRGDWSTCLIGVQKYESGMQSPNRSAWWRRALVRNDHSRAWGAARDSNFLGEQDPRPGEDGPPHRGAREQLTQPGNQPCVFKWIIRVGVRRCIHMFRTNCAPAVRQKSAPGFAGICDFIRLSRLMLVEPAQPTMRTRHQNLKMLLRWFDRRKMIFHSGK